MGICCGNQSHFIRSMAEGIGRSPPASKYSEDMSKHYAMGNHSSLKKYYTEKVSKL